MISNHIVVPFILRDFNSDAEYLELQEKKTKMIQAGEHRTTETIGEKKYYVYTPAFIELNNRLLTLEGLRNWGGGDQHYRLLTPEERANITLVELRGKEVR